MGELPALAVTILSQGARRLDVIAQNVANATTPAYKRKIAFSALVASGSGSDLAETRIAVDRRQGALRATGDPRDLAILGGGCFPVRRGDAVGCTRAASIARSADGAASTRDGVLIDSYGRDLNLPDRAFVVSPDGNVTANGMAVGRLSIVDDDGAPVNDAVVKQGFTEASNVDVGQEMVAMLETLRRAEAGQRIMTAYDELMGRVLTSIGESVR